MGHETYKQCFNSCVRPILEYGAEVWGYHKGENIENVYNKAIKVYLGVNRFAANLAVIGDIGWVPPALSRKLCMIRYWNRLIDMDDTRLTKKVFDYVHATQSTKWCKMVCNTLSEIQMEDNFWYKMPCDIRVCREKLMEIYMQKWKNLVTKKPKLRTYIEIKKSFYVENYITLNLDRSHRSILAQLRCGTLPLHIETGRFSNTKVEDRLCNFCSEEAVESEYHFLFHCSHYSHERTQFYQTLSKYPRLHILNDSAKLNFLFNMEPRMLARYTVQIFSKRQDKMIK